MSRLSNRRKRAVPPPEASASGGGLAAEVRAEAARLEPLLAGERLTTEGLTDAIYGQIFGEPHVDQAVFGVVRRAAELAASGITAAAVVAARTAARRGYAGASGVLAGGIQVQVVSEQPSLYVELRRDEAFLVLRIETDPRAKGRRCGWIHEIQATARDALDMLTALASAWTDLGGGSPLRTAPARLIGDDGIPGTRAVA